MTFMTTLESHFHCQNEFTANENENLTAESHFRAAKTHFHHAEGHFHLRNENEFLPSKVIFIPRMETTSQCQDPFWFWKWKSLLPKWEECISGKFIFSNLPGKFIPFPFRNEFKFISRFSFSVESHFAKWESSFWPKVIFIPANGNELGLPPC